MTLEAFADTIVPGEKRHPDDHAIAGVSTGGGAVTSGALELLSHPAGGLADVLEPLSMGLNAQAAGYAQAQSLALDEALPPFVALPFEHRTALVQQLVGPENPEKGMWVGLALFSNMAFDSAAHISTADALAAGHPGLLTIGYAPPGPDRLWRFEPASYGRPLAPMHPHTTASGSPA
ncbi:DUF5987 family protein [Dactylosporangium sp. CS-047395]|uniref:DUF5987 family protein n=1 Tax=Dactylosporangium sp. CS-047395 TaxID=3239936 RepID=UPI003D90BB77